MTFPVPKPGGWTDDIDTITGSEITTIDVNLHDAIDGAGGGSYSPSAPLRIGGAGLDIRNGILTTMSGPILLNSDEASIRYRINRTKIAPSVTIPTQDRIDTGSDIYIASGPAGAGPCEVILNVSGIGINPVTGNRVIVKKWPDPAALPSVLDTVDMLVYNDNTLPASLLLTMPALSNALPLLNPHVTAEFVFNGSTAAWEVVRCHYLCTI